MRDVELKKIYNTINNYMKSCAKWEQYITKIEKENEMSAINRDLNIRSVRVEKDKLLKTLYVNREKHTEEYMEAKEGYRDKLIEDYHTFLDKVSDTIKQLGDTTIDLSNVGLYFTHPRLEKPENHTEDYTTAIEMLEWSIDDYVDLQHHEFEQFVQDRWDWTDKHFSISQTYSGKK